MADSMVNNKSFCKILSLVIFVALDFSSCIREESSPEYKYFVSGDVVMTYNQAYINFLISTGAVTISGNETLAPYASIRSALNANSISAWQTMIPLLLINGEREFCFLIS